MSYGFWRNSLALKPLAIVVLVAAVLAQVLGFIWLAVPQSTSVRIFVAFLDVALLCYWTIAVSRGRVRRQGEIYADRLFVAANARSRMVQQRHLRGRAER